MKTSWLSLQKVRAILGIRRSAAPLLACVLVALAGCGHGHEHHDDEDHRHSEAPSASADHSGGSHHEGHDDGLQLTLNNGAKWQMDAPTRESAAKLTSLVAGAAAIESIEDGRALGQALDEELDTLVQRCKMTGPAHDQLHVFLIALFPQVQALREKTEIEELRLARRAVGDLFAAYEKHFE